MSARRRNDEPTFVVEESIIDRTPARRQACAISELDFHLLVEGAGAGTWRTWRDVAAGACVSGLIGSLGLLATVDLTKMGPLAATVVIVTFALTVASAFVCAVAHKASTTEPARQSYQACVSRIRRDLGLMTPAGDGGNATEA